MDIPVEVIMGAGGTAGASVGAVWVFMKNRLSKAEAKAEEAQAENANHREKIARLETRLQMVKTGKSYKAKARPGKLEKIMAEIEAWNKEQEQNGNDESIS